MKSDISMFRLKSQKPQGSHIALIGIGLLLTILLLHPVPTSANNAHDAPKDDEKKASTRCIVCDSQRDPLCREDAPEDPNDYITTTVSPIAELDPSAEKSSDGAGGNIRRRRQADGSSATTVAPEQVQVSSTTEATNQSAHHLSKYEMDCPPRRSWCYKSEGRIVTVNYTGHVMYIWKVDRGCTKPYFERACVRVKQEDETDFRVCFCKGKFCNKRMNVFKEKLRKSSGAPGVRSNLAGILVGLLWFLLVYSGTT